MCLDFVLCNTERWENSTFEPHHLCIRWGRLYPAYLLIMVIGLHLQIPHGLQAYHTEYSMPIPNPCAVWQDSESPHCWRYSSGIGSSRLCDKIQSFNVFPYRSRFSPATTFSTLGVTGSFTEYPRHPHRASRCFHLLTNLPISLYALLSTGLNFDSGLTTAKWGAFY